MKSMTMVLELESLHNTLKVERDPWMYSRDYEENQGKKHI